MRVRDIVRASFDRLVESGAVPGYEPQGRYVPALLRHNPTWRPEQGELVHYGAPDGALYEDEAAWRVAVAAVRAFTAAAAGRSSLPWRLPALGGSFGEVPPGDLLHHLAAALADCGLRAGAPNTIAHAVRLEATDAVTVSGLPEPYGAWLQAREGRPRWKEKVELRLVVQARARVALRRDGSFDAYADLALSAPAVSLVQDVALALGRPLPLLGGSAWLLPDAGHPTHGGP